MTFRELLDEIAAKSPTPGGGAVAAITAALAAALAQMVVNYSIGKKSLAAHDLSNLTILQGLDETGRAALRLAQEDAEAYGRLNELWKLPEADPARQSAMPAAVEGAIQPPREMVAKSLEMLRDLEKLVKTTNPHLKSDLAIAALLANAAAQAAAWNVRINIPLLSDSQKGREMQSQLEADLSESERISRAIDLACRT